MRDSEGLPDSKSWGLNFRFNIPSKKGNDDEDCELDINYLSHSVLSLVSSSPVY